tara:strand:- start:334 stop:618 length:285 start_codon:yes stop_codon:yes gene_type:complete
LIVSISCFHYDVPGLLGVFKPCAGVATGVFNVVLKDLKVAFFSFLGLNLRLPNLNLSPSSSACCDGLICGSGSGFGTAGGGGAGGKGFGSGVSG